jgi:prolipoprotein diacylglyceryl transferase
VTLAFLPSPSSGVLHLGPIPLRGYAFCILLGVLVAVVMGNRRFVARGGQPGAVADVAVVAVPFGLVGARLYHCITSPAAYLDDPVRILYIWQGGLGIPGGILGGVLAGLVVCRRRGIAPGAFADAIAPGVVIAQAIGRFGNYVNQELFGRPTTLPWGLRIDPDNRPAEYAGVATFHPTFLYEALWNVGVALIVIWADRRFQLSRGRAFALYLALYAVGRAWIEALRVDEATTFFGVRLNDYVMAVVFAGAVAYLVARRGAPREQVVQRGPDDEPAGPSGEAPDPGADVASRA